MKRIFTGLIILAVIAFVGISNMPSGTTKAATAQITVCPDPGIWVMAVWNGPDGTPTDQALKTCPSRVDFVWSLTPKGQWVGYNSAAPQASDLKNVNGLQALMLKGYKEPVPLPYPACSMDVDMPPGGVNITAPSQDLDPKLAALSGIWEGKWNDSDNAPSLVVVENINATKAYLVYSVTLKYTNSETRQWARSQDGAKVLPDGGFQWGTGITFSFKIGNDLKTLNGERVEGQLISKIAMTRCSLPQ